jgi:caa(3)-type oxidase subunit IV
MQPSSHKAHPTPRFYITVFGWLAIMTVLEVMIAPTAHFGLPDIVRIPSLVVIAVIKAILVVMFYMHLRYDSRWYTAILLTGLFFALLIGRLLMAMAS